MGIFSSKYVTTVGTSVSRLIADDKVPNAIKTGSLKAFFEEGEFTEYVMEEVVTSIGLRADRMYNYAEKSYVHGLPSGEIYTSTQGRQKVEAVIEAQEGQQVLMEYSHFGPPNTLHIGWMKLISQYGYNSSTNELSVLSTLKGKPVYLQDMQVVVPESQIDTFEAGALDQWGISPKAGYSPSRLVNTFAVGSLSKTSDILKSATATEVHLKVTYVWEGTPVPSTATPPITTEVVTLSVAEFDPTADFFHAAYNVNGQRKYWLYKNKTGVYPTLDNVFVDGPAVSGSYFPFAYFRYNKQSVIQDKTTDAYKTSKKMVKYLGVDYDLMAETIDENPDIADVEQAMLVMGIPAASTNPIECRYLFEYFDELFYSMGGATYSAMERIFNKLNNDTAAKRAIIIKDNLFKMSLNNTNISKKIVAGSIGKIGTHTSQYQATETENSYVDESTGETIVVITPGHTHVYRKQIAIGLYEQVSVENLRMTYFVFENYTTVGDGSGTTLLIPIDKTISSKYTISERETLYSRSLHMVFNSRSVTKLEWYETGVFQVILIIIAIVITIYTYGADGGSAIATALGLSGTAGLIATIVFNVIVGAIFPAVFKIFVKVFGQDVATLIAIAALVYGGYQVATKGVAGAPFASQLLSISSGLTNAVLSDKMSDLMQEGQAFKLLADEKTELLGKASALLENTSFLSPFVVFGEKPEDFYNRTVHSGNIGILGINAISSYVDIALTLPTFNDTLGEDPNGNNSTEPVYDNG